MTMNIPSRYTGKSSMKKTAIVENFYQYQFPPRPKKHFGFNIFVLINGKNALLIDTGYEDHASAVKDDLLATGIEPRKIIISHFHDDHIYGLQMFSNLQVFGSGLYQASLDLYTLKEYHERFKPTDILTDASSLKFGDFHLRFIVMPGHAICNLFTIISDQFIHIGDDIMSSNDGVPLLPSVEFDRISEHIKSLEKLREYKGHTLLLAHGNPISGESDVLEAIDNRLKYLRTVFQSRSRISYEEATKECTCNFLHKEWHEYLYT